MKETNLNITLLSQGFDKGWRDPLDVYSSLHKKEFSYLLELCDEKTKELNLSIIGYEPYITLIFRKNKVTIIKERDSIILSGINPVSFLKELISGLKLIEDKDLLPFKGGLVGFFSYEFIKNIEDISIPHCESRDIPDAILTISKRYLLFDHKKKRITALLLSIDDKDCSNNINSISLQKALCELREMIAQRNNEIKFTKKIKLKDFRTNLTQREFKNIVQRAKDYIKSGEVIQVVLSRRFSWSFLGDVFILFRNIRKINPSPYMFYMNFGDMKLIGASPEKLVSLEENKVELCPIAGTRPRGEDIHKDIMFENELLNDSKEIAEHVMLVDLGRNDLGRISIPGSVRVSEFMEVYRFSHVMHIVSRIEGRRREDKDAVDILCATFPAGTVTGAPKIRAMEIIGELENTWRGPYAGATGYISFDGSMNFCITIRSLYTMGERIFFQAGAGIVHDSIPQKELEEITNKASAIFHAGRLDLPS